MGNALKDSGKIKESIDCYKKAIELNPNFPNAYDNLGNALNYDEKIMEAIECFKKSIDLDPNYAEGYFNLSILELSRGYFEKWMEKF